MNKILCVKYAQIFRFLLVWLAFVGMMLVVPVATAVEKAANASAVAGASMPLAKEREPVTLHLWSIPRKTATDPQSVAIRRVFEAFCRRHPEIRVTALVPLRIEGPAQESNQFLAIAGGVAPDVFTLYGRKVGDYIAQKFLLPLNPYLADYAKRYGKPYAGVAAPNSVWELCVRKDQIMAVPEGYYSMALTCDINMFAQAGFAGRYPQDWDELYEMARRMTFDPAKEPGANLNLPVRYGISLLTGIFAGWHYLQYVWSAGGQVVQPYLPVKGKLEPVPMPPIDYRPLHVKLSNEKAYADLQTAIKTDLRKRGIPDLYSIDDLQWRLETDGPDAIQALMFYRKLAHQPWLRNGDHEFDLTPEMFKNRKAVDPQTGETFDLDDPGVQGRIYYGVSSAVAMQSGQKMKNVFYAMGVGTIGEISTTDPRVTAYVPFPSRKGYPPAAFIAGYYLGVNAAIQTEDLPGRRDRKAIQEAAWKYIEFCTGHEAEQIRIKTFIEYGLAEFVRPSLLENAGYADILARIEPERLQMWDNLLHYDRVEPYCKGFTHVMSRELNMAIEPIIGDLPDPETGEYQCDPQAIMTEVCRNVNTMILGKIPDEVVRKRSRVGWVIFGVIAVGLVLGGRLILRLAMKAQSKVRDEEGFGVGGNAARRRLYAWLFLIPAVASVAIWAYYPLTHGMLMAFQNYSILGHSTFVGLRNFIEAASEPKFWRYLFQTFQYMVMLVGIGFCVPIILAILLTEIPKGKIFYRIIYYLPAVTTGLVTMFLWKNLLFDSQSTGALNVVILAFNQLPLWAAAGLKLGALVLFAYIAVMLVVQAFQPWLSSRGRWISGAGGVLLASLVLGFLARIVAQEGWAGLMATFVSQFDFKAQLFLRDPKMALFWVIVPTIWAGAGPGCLIYLAALKGIPDEQYEAADLDGAGFWHKVFNVTYPNLKALIMINFIGAVIGGFKESSNIFVMTGGGPVDATMTTGLYIWYNAFMFLNFGLSTAMAWIMGAILIGFTMTQLRILDKLQFKAANTEGK